MNESYDYMNDRTEVYKEPRISLGFFKDREKDLITVKVAILLALALFFVCGTAAILSPPHDTEQSALDRGYVWVLNTKGNHNE